nr:MAG TPA: hypothetical protein [Caudoviricetes sp.]
MVLKVRTRLMVSGTVRISRVWVYHIVILLDLQIQMTKNSSKRK